MATLAPASVPSACCVARAEEWRNSSFGACTSSGRAVLWKGRVRCGGSGSGRKGCAEDGFGRVSVGLVEEEGGGFEESLIESDVFEQVFQAPRKRVAPLVGTKGWRVNSPGNVKRHSLIPEEWKPVQAERNKSGPAIKKEFIAEQVKAAQEREARRRAVVNGGEEEVVQRTFLPQTRPSAISGGYVRFPVSEESETDEDDLEIDGFEADADDSELEELRWDWDGSEDVSGRGREKLAETDRNRFGRNEVKSGERGVVLGPKAGAAVSKRRVSGSVGRAEPRDPFAAIGERSFADAVKRITDGSEVESTSGEGYGPIQRPPKWGQTGIELDGVKALFKKRPANFLRTGSEKWKALHTLAASWERSINLKQMLTYDVDINEHDKDGMTALHRAVCNGRRTTVKFLVEEGADAEVRDKDGATLLHYAARAGVSDVARDLLKIRLDPNVVDDAGWTPLHVAVQSGRRDIVKRFLTYGAECNIPNKDGCTAVDLALSFARAFDFYEIVKLFPLSQDQKTILQQEGTWEEKEAARHSFKNFGSTGLGKWMLLHTLAASGNLFHLCELLRQGGIDLNAQDKDGHTALWKSVVYGKPSSAKHLVEAGADPFLTDSHGATLLHHAAQNGFVDNIKKLTKRRVYVNTPDEDGWTPLHVAVQAGRKDVILCLLNRGADRFCRNKDGNMVLDIAASFGRKFGYYQVAKVISKAQFRNAEEKFAEAELAAEEALATADV